MTFRYFSIIFKNNTMQNLFLILFLLITINFRPQFELYDTMKDPLERFNLAYDEKHQSLLGKMKSLLSHWLNATRDPFRCAPSAVLEDAGNFKFNPTCMAMDNNL